MQGIDRFRELVGGPDRMLPLDEAALLIAQHVDSTVDPARWLSVLDELADSCSEPTFSGLRHLMFEQAGFRGDEDHYADPANSMLHQVLERRLGIPITLSIVMVALGRRLAVAVEPIGMPGHFLVRDPTAAVFCDPFHGGVLLDAAGCKARFEAIFSGSQVFSAEMLVPVSDRAVLARVLANLERGPLGRDLGQLARITALHASIPGLGPAERLALAELFNRLGSFDEAARELDLVAQMVGDERRPDLQIRARRLRARAN